MFTINLGDGREAPSKARKKGAKRLEFLVIIYLYRIMQSMIQDYLSLKFESPLTEKYVIKISAIKKSICWFQ